MTVETLPVALYEAFLPVGELLRRQWPAQEWTVQIHPEDYFRLVSQVRDDLFPEEFPGFRSVLGFPVRQEASVRRGFLRAVCFPGTVREIRIETAFALVCACGEVIPNPEDWPPFAFAGRCGKCRPPILLAARRVT